MGAQERFRSAFESTSRIRVLACTQWVAKDPSFLHVDSKDSDQTGRSLRWAHMPFCFVTRWLTNRLSPHYEKIPKGKEYTFWGRNSFKIVVIAFRSKFFCFRVDSFSVRILCVFEQSESYQSCITGYQI